MIINEKQAKLIVDSVETILGLDENYVISTEMSDLLDLISSEYPQLYSECRYLISTEQDIKKISFDKMDLL